MNLEEDFSPVERERASAFVKAFGKSKIEKPSALPKKEPLLKPKIKAMVTDPNVLDAEPEPVATPVLPKVTIGAEYNIIKQQEAELKSLVKKTKSSSGGFTQLVTMLLILAFLFLLFYNFDAIIKIRKEQERIIGNQKVIFDKLNRIGKHLRF